jgi:hypothetical protein
MFRGCGDAEEEKVQASPLKHSVRDIQVVDEIHTSLLPTLQEYETKPITGLNLLQIEPLLTTCLVCLLWN